VHSSRLAVRIFDQAGFFDLPVVDTLGWLGGLDKLDDLLMSLIERRELIEMSYKPLLAGRSPDSWSAADPANCDVELYFDGHRLFIRGMPVHLSHKEFVILRHLMTNVGRVVNRRELMDNLWVRVRRMSELGRGQIRRLRAKIETGMNKSTRVRTVRGIGYIFDLS
jgi:DNA-binding response OmpR family regulator